MAKIGTAHIEIKPVLNEEALDALVKRIEDAIAEGVARGLHDHDMLGKRSFAEVLNVAARKAGS